MRPADDTPLSASELTLLFAGLKGSRLALAVSGGADSLALLVAIARWQAAPEQATTIVLTVDHRLRPESALEAEGVAAIAAACGFAARVLAWTGSHPETGIEAAARSARYRLLTAAAHAAGATHLVTAHHADDQAETFLMRLARGAGVMGLAAMRSEVDAGSLMLARPFLSIPRSRLAATARAAGLTPVEDAMNADRRYFRTRIRALAPALTAAGLSSARLTALAARMGNAAAAIEIEANTLLERAVTADAFAVARLNASLYARAPSDVRLRALARLLLAIGGGDYAPRHQRLNALDAFVTAMSNQAAAKRTLAGVVVDRHGDRCLFYRERGRAPLPAFHLPPGFEGEWDHRFRITVSHTAPSGMTVSALGNDAGWLSRTIPQTPKAALAVLPAVRKAERLVAIPDGRHDMGQAGAMLRLTPLIADRLRRPALFPHYRHNG